MTHGERPIRTQQSTSPALPPRQLRSPPSFFVIRHSSFVIRRRGGFNLNKTMKGASSSAQDARELFRRHFGLPPTRIVTAPGRLELLGNHTDYNAGIVLAF